MSLQVRDKTHTRLDFKLTSLGGGGACVECAMEAHHGVALVESWTGRDARNAGSIDEATLHDKIRDQLEKFCDGSKAGFCGKSMQVHTDHSQPY